MGIILFACGGGGGGGGGGTDDGGVKRIYSPDYLSKDMEQDLYLHGKQRYL